MPTAPDFPRAPRPEIAAVIELEGRRRWDAGAGTAYAAAAAPKDILVLVDDMPSRVERVQLACRLARRFGAHLTGLYPLGIPDLPPAAADMPGFSPAGPADAFYEDERAVAAGIGRLFEETAGREHVSAEWRAEPGNAVAIATKAALHADLAVLGQPDADFTPLLAPQVRPEDIILAAGRPALVVPHSGHFTTVGERVLIAWQPTREAARAVNDALPLLRGAAEVRIVTVDAAAPAGAAAPAAEIAIHLARHGIDTTVECAASSSRGGGGVATILTRAAEHGSDLVVMGAYARTRAQQIVLGDVTRGMLRHMTVPVFMSY
ncbi:MAG TPA: universal stress protein [Stellaceae bacterium]